MCVQYLWLKVFRLLTDSLVVGQRRNRCGCHLSWSGGHRWHVFDQLGLHVILLFATYNINQDLNMLHYQNLVKHYSPNASWKKQSFQWECRYLLVFGFKTWVIHLCSCQLCVMADSAARLRAARLIWHDWSRSVSFWHLEQTHNASLHIQIQEKKTVNPEAPKTFWGHISSTVRNFSGSRSLGHIQISLFFLNTFSSLTFHLSLRHNYLPSWSDQYACSFAVVTGQILHLCSKIWALKTELY